MLGSATQQEGSIEGERQTRQDWMLIKMQSSSRTTELAAEVGTHALLDGGAVAGAGTAEGFREQFFLFFSGLPGNRGVRKICRCGFNTDTFPQSKKLIMRSSNWSRDGTRLPGVWALAISVGCTK